jgi:hypothetical protein
VWFSLYIFTVFTCFGQLAILLCVFRCRWMGARCKATRTIRRLRCWGALGRLSSCVLRGTCVAPSSSSCSKPLPTASWNPRPLPHPLPHHCLASQSAQWVVHTCHQKCIHTSWVLSLVCYGGVTDLQAVAIWAEHSWYVDVRVVDCFVRTRKVPVVESHKSSFINLENCFCINKFISSLSVFLYVMLYKCSKSRAPSLGPFFFLYYVCISFYCFSSR